MHVLIADSLAAGTTERLEAAGCRVTVDSSLRDDSLTAALAAHNPAVLVVRSTKVRAPQLAATEGLRLIIRAGAGVNTIDRVTCAQRGVSVANCPGKNAIAVAELAMGHLINLDRRIADNVAALRGHRWAKKKFSKARGLYGRTLAVLGTGQIGRAVITRAQAFGMNIRGWDIALTPEWAEDLGIDYAASPLEACAGADAVTIHLALNDGTRGLVGAELLAALARGAYVINTSRGGVIDQPALIAAIRERGLRAGLDVFADEPGAGDDRFEHAIADEAGVYGTHHIGASTDQATQAVAAEVIRIVVRFGRDGHIENRVEAP